MKKPVLILDTHRGIYFGDLVAKYDNDARVKLKNARHCFYFPVAELGHKGVYGLATVGPAKGAKVGPRVDMIIRDVAKIVTCTPSAVARWESATWE
jgi:hypothetical protein